MSTDICGIVYLSDEVYEVLIDATPNVKKGTRVRLISGVDGNNTPGYHMSPSYRTVCPVVTDKPRWVGVEWKHLKKVSP